jgi:hypothetical protein
MGRLGRLIDMTGAFSWVRGRRVHAGGRRSWGRLVAPVVMVAIATPAGAVAPVLPNASWEVVGDLQMPSFSGVAVPLSGVSTTYRKRRNQRRSPAL